MTIFRKGIVLSLSIVLFSGYSSSIYASSCSATNDNEDAQCSIDCPIGEVAECIDGTGSSVPTCECLSDDSNADEEEFDDVTLSVDARSYEQYFSSGGFSKNSLLASATWDNSRGDVAIYLNQKLANLKDYKISEKCEFICQRWGKNSCVGYIPLSVDLPGTDQLMNSGPESDLSQILPVTSGYRACCEGGNRCTTKSGKLQVVNLTSYESQGIEYVPADDVIPLQPGDLRIQKTSYLNCTSSDQKLTHVFDKSIAKGETVSFAKATKESVGVTVTLEAKFEVFGIGGKAGAQKKVSRDITLTEQKKYDFRKTEKETLTLPLIIPAKSKVTLRGLMLSQKGNVDFRSTVIADGRVTANREGVTNVSDVLSEADRTVELYGTISYADASDLEVEVFQDDDSCDDKNELEVVEQLDSLIQSAEWLSSEDLDE